jgi:hypothetical protein
MVEKSAVIGQFLPQKTQGGQDTVQRIGGGNEVPLGSNAKSSKTEAGRSNAGWNSLTVGVNVTAVLDHSRFRTALFPKKKKMCFLQVIQKLVVFR